MYTDDDKNPGDIPDVLLPPYLAKSLGAMKAPRAVKRITFRCTEAVPSDTLYILVSDLNENDVLVPGSLALRFDIDLEGRQANNFLVLNVTRALVDKLVVEFEGTTLWGTTSTKRLKTCFVRSNGATTWCRRGSRAKSCVRYAIKPGTKNGCRT